VRCQECQERAATLHFTKIVNGEKMEMHLCEQCAKGKGDIFPGQNSFSIHHLLSGLLNFDQPIKQAGANNFPPMHRLQCSKCGMTFEQFAKIGRFGCANCYETFNHKLDPLLKKVHGGNTVHAGKIPKRSGNHIHLKKRLEDLKRQLQVYIEREEFEKAAQVRDEIRALEKSNMKDGGE